MSDYATVMETRDEKDTRGGFVRSPERQADPRFGFCSGLAEMHGAAGRLAGGDVACSES